MARLITDQSIQPMNLETKTSHFNPVELFMEYSYGSLIFLTITSN